MQFRVPRFSTTRVPARFESALFVGLLIVISLVAADGLSAAMP